MKHNHTNWGVWLVCFIPKLLYTLRNCTWYLKCRWISGSWSCVTMMVKKSSNTDKLKVKCALVQALRFCTGRTAHRGSRGIALLFLDHGTRRGWGVSVMPRPLFTPGKDPVPIVQEAGWASGPVWTGAENLTPTGIRSPDRPASSQLLYQLRYQAHPTLIAGTLTLTLLTWIIRWAPNNASEWQVGFNSVFEGLMIDLSRVAI